MKIEFERCKDTEKKHNYYRYYKAIKYIAGNRYIPKYNPFLRSHSVCIYKNNKQDYWCLWFHDWINGNRDYFKYLHDAKGNCRGYLKQN